MKFGDIKGESTEDRHKDWIELSSYQWGVGRGNAGPTGSAVEREGRPPSVSEIVITKPTDASSPALRALSVRGGVRRDVIIEETDPRGRVLIRYVLKDAMISSYSLSGGGARPMERLTLTVSRVERQAVPGTVEGTRSREMELQRPPG
jgi:type VI secretion system secreted protein Hcp